MASSLRELRERRRSVVSIKQITHAMELIASSRIIKAQKNARSARPYTDALTDAISALATYKEIEHPLLEEVRPARRSAMLLITSDRGMAGAYSNNAIKAAEQLHKHLVEQGQEVLQYMTGGKGMAYFRFRNRHVEQHWTGFSDAPSYSHAREIARVLMDRFLLPYEEGGVDQIHVVGTRFHSMLVQRTRAIRLLPLVVEDEDSSTTGGSTLPYYAFEPSPEKVLDELLPMYVSNRVYTALLQSAASELASRQQAMKSATDNAQDLIESLTRQANQARQAQITQEISEITGGAAALADSA